MSRPFDEITLEEVATWPRPGYTAPGSIRFTPDSKLVTFLWSESGSLTRSLWALDPATGERRVLAEAPPESADERTLSREEALRRERARLRETGITSYQFAPEADPPILLVPLRGRLFLRIGDGPLEELPGTEGALDPRLTRDGRRVAFVVDDELHAMDLPGGEPRRLTFDAEEGVTNGVAEYIAHEELGRSRGFWWSRDGRRIAFVHADSRHVPLFPIVHQGGDEVDVEEHRYPFAGRPNAKVALRVVPAEGGDAVGMDLGPDEDVYLARVAWAPDGSLHAAVLDRAQARLDRFRMDPDSGRATLVRTERGEPWLNLDHDTRLLAGGEMLRSSEASGVRQLHLDDRPLTDGEEPVVALLAVDEERRVAYYRAATDRALGRHVYAVSLDGGPARRLTNGPGWHDAIFSPDHRLFVHVESSLERPPRVSLRETEGGELAVIHEDPDAAAEALGLAPPRLVEIEAEDGTILNGAIYEPPAGGGRRPVIVSVYGGPHAQRVADEWSLTVDLRAQYLARRGYLVLKVDNRGSANRGLAFEAPLHLRMGTVEVRDQVAGVRSLAGRDDVDLERVGVYGWSYGGYMTLLCLARAPEVFRVGVAGAPVTDWDGYDTGYTERYMGTPESNPEGYREASVLTHVDRIEGRVLVVHGMIDENVHFRHTARLLARLQKTGRSLDLLALPAERHMPRDRDGLRYLEREVTGYFERWL